MTCLVPETMIIINTHRNQLGGGEEGAELLPQGHHHDKEEGERQRELGGLDGPQHGQRHDLGEGEQMHLPRWDATHKRLRGMVLDWHQEEAQPAIRQRENTN